MGSLDGTTLYVVFAVAAALIIWVSYAVRGAAASGSGFGRNIMGKLIVSVLAAGLLAGGLHLAGIIHLPIP